MMWASGLGIFSLHAWVDQGVHRRAVRSYTTKADSALFEADRNADKRAEWTLMWTFSTTLTQVAKIPKKCEPVTYRTCTSDAQHWDVLTPETAHSYEARPG